MKGVLWYSRPKWSVLREGSPQTDDLGEDYAVWRESTEAHIASLEQAGHRVIRVDVDVRRLNAWCRKRGLEVTRSARAQYAIERIQSQLSVEKKTLAWRKLWKRWLVLLIPWATSLVLWKWYVCSPYASRSMARSLEPWSFLVVGLLFLSSLFGMGVLLLVGVQAVKHRGAARREYLAAGAVAIFAILFPFAVGRVNGALDRNAMERVRTRGKSITSAIARFHDDRGHPPSALSKLVPEYLKSIPSTGLGVCPRFQYRLLGRTLVWYDLGLHRGDFTSSGRSLDTIGRPSHAYLVLHLGSDHRVLRYDAIRLPRSAQHHLFDPERWQRETSSRVSMMHDLIVWRSLKGYRPEEIVRLLGKSDGRMQRHNVPWELTFYCYSVIKSSDGRLTYRPKMSDVNGFSARERARLGKWTRDSQQ